VSQSETPMTTMNGGRVERWMAFDKLEHVLLYLLHRSEISADALLVVIEAQKRVIYG
jgi:hypothetical protein